MINLSKSILTIGKNQQVQYSEIFIGIEHITIATDEIGCALAASPYFTLAQGAFPKSNAIHHLSLEEWEATVASQFLYNSETKQ